MIIYELSNRLPPTLGQGSELDTKYHILHDCRTSAPFEEKSFDHFKDLHKVELLTNFDVNLTSFPGGVIN